MATARIAEAAELADLLAEGRAALAAKRAAEQAGRERREKEADAARLAAFGPVWAACLRLLPECWHESIDARDGEFSPAAWEHTVYVRLAGLAPIAVGLHAGRTRDDAWALGTRPFRVCRYEAWHGDESRSVIPCSRLGDWQEAGGPAEAMALAEESWARRRELQAECERDNAARAKRAELRAAKPPVLTPDERFVAALREWVGREASPGE